MHILSLIFDCLYESKWLIIKFLHCLILVYNKKPITLITRKRLGVVGIDKIGQMTGNR